MLYCSVTTCSLFIVIVRASPALEGEHEFLEGDGAVLVEVELLYPLVAYGFGGETAFHALQTSWGVGACRVLPHLIQHFTGLDGAAGVVVEEQAARRVE